MKRWVAHCCIALVVFGVLTLAVQFGFTSNQSTTFATITSTASTQQHIRHRGNNNCSALAIPRAQAVFLHPGKSAGGSFMYRSRHLWKFHIAECHPDPCDDDFALSNNTTIAIISIRDPVDRFVSAFHWKTKTICTHYPNLCTSAKAWKQQQDLHPNRPVPARAVPTTVDGSSSSNSTSVLVHDDLEAMQRYILFEKYQQNANLLAESLCKGANNSTAFEEAQNDVRTIAHMKTSIHDWLADWDILASPSNAAASGRQTMPITTTNIRPIVLEPGFDLEQQIDDALRAITTPAQMDFRGDWCPRRRPTKEEGGGGGAATTNNIQRRGGKRQRGTARNKQQKKLHVHSSVEAHHPSFVAHTPLSKKGTRCVAQFYRRDYEIIRRLYHSSTCGETCRLALESIWNRRAPLLSDR